MESCFCGLPLQPKGRAGRPEKYCSDGCRTQARRQRRRHRQTADRHSAPNLTTSPPALGVAVCRAGFFRTCSASTRDLLPVVVDGEAVLGCWQCRIVLGGTSRNGAGDRTNAAATVDRGPGPRHAADPFLVSLQPAAYTGRHFDQMIVQVDAVIVHHLNLMSDVDVLDSEFVADLRTKVRDRSRGADKATRTGISRIRLVVHGRRLLHPQVTGLISRHLGGREITQTLIPHPTRQPRL